MLFNLTKETDVPCEMSPYRAGYHSDEDFIFYLGCTRLNVGGLRYVLNPFAVGQWLRCCVTNRKVAGSIPDGVIGIFH